MRFYTGFLFVLAFWAWILYQAFIKKDMKRAKNDLLVVLFFSGVWGLIYWICMS
jgi:hypothetical protein